MSKYEVFSGPYFPALIPNTEKYGPGKTPYLDTFHAVGSILNDLMAQYGLIQIIHEPTHILESSVSCIDLVFTSRGKLGYQFGSSFIIASKLSSPNLTFF